MAEAQNIKLHTRQSTSGRAHWGHHWRGERNLTTLQKIKDGNFDVVVLQNHSTSAMNRADSLVYFGQRLNDLAKSSGAQVYLYMTWAREWDPYMQATITEQYTKLAEKLHARIVPVGPAWERAR